MTIPKIWHRMIEVNNEREVVEMVKLGTEYGFEWDGIWITDPTVSECGRFEVDPITYNGLTQEQYNFLRKQN